MSILTGLKRKGEKKMLLYIIRHGETAWNHLCKIQGNADIPLNENGIELAKITAEKLRDVSFDLAIASPLQRALVTAELILEGREVPIIKDSRIQEIDFGELEGLAVDKSDPKSPIYPFFHDPFHFQPAKGGESVADVCRRTKDFYEDITTREEYQDKTILVATHGCALRGILNSVYEDKTDFWHGKVCPNCGVNVVEVKNGRARLLEDDKIYY